MDFSPYQSDAPSDTRPLSPPPRPFSPASASHKPISPPLSPPLRPHHGATQGFGNTRGGSSYLPINGDENASSGMPTSNTELYSTSLGLPIKVEAVLAYLVLPPAGGVVLLILEWGSDYVRFHAWQSALVFAAMFLLHLVFVWSAFLSYSLLVVNVGLVGVCSYRAWVDAESLERFELPFFGQLAGRWVDEE